MKKHCRLIVLTLTSALVSAFLPAPAMATLTDSWQRVQMALTEPDPEILKERVRELKDVAVEVDARRLTPYAESLVAWAAEHPDEIGNVVVMLAQELDPELPAAPFLEARLAWAQGSLFRALGAYIRGWTCTLRDSIVRRNILSSAAAWLLLSVGTALGVVVILQTVRQLRMVVHDAYELGLVLFQRANAFIFTIVVLTLPFFAGLGPVWLVAYLFALGWSYIPNAQRAAAVTVCILMVLVVPLLESWQNQALQPLSVGDRVLSMLDERRIDPSTLRDFIELGPSLETSPTYYLLLGELFRIHGDHDAAEEEFRRASFIDSNWAMPFIFSGNIAAENGDMKKAIRQYQDATDIDSGSAFAYLNLSFALDQDSQFREATEARHMAQGLLPGGVDIEKLGVRGVLSRIRYPRLGEAEMERLYSEIRPEMLKLIDIGGAPVGFFSFLANPFSAVFGFTCILGGVLLLLRKKWMWTGQACVKCGKVFCPRCKSATESATYCSQCISVFLKRDEVAMDQQQAKMSQIERWKMLNATGQRIVAALLPGGGLVLVGKMWLGLLFSCCGWLCIVGIFVWAPQFLRSVEPMAAVLPTQVFLSLLFLVVWLLSFTLTWNRR
jgi:tetratricopeptide (TPR) repeat protein